MRHMPTLLLPLRGATPSNSDPSGRDTRESTSSRRGSPAKLLVGWGGAKAIGMRGARSFSTSSSSVGSCGPLSWSSSVCGSSSRTPNGWNRFVNISAAWAMDSLSGRNRPLITWLRSLQGASLRQPGMTIGTRPRGRCGPSSRVRHLPDQPPWDRRASLGRTPPEVARSTSRTPRRDAIPGAVLREVVALEGIRPCAEQRFRAPYHS